MKSKGLISLAVALAISIPAIPAFADADDVGALKDAVEQLKSDYEDKIETLENKIHELEARQGEEAGADVDAKIEARVDAVRDELTAQMNAPRNNSFEVEYLGRHNAPVGDGGLVVRNPHGFGNVSLGGYADIEYRDLQNSESTFRHHRWILNVGAQVTERIRFNSEYEIEYGGPNSSGGDGEAKVEQAYIDFLINDMVNLRAGALLTPFGRYNIYHDSDLQDLTDRPLMARDIVPTTWTEAGAGFFGSFEPVIGDYEDLTVNYELYAINGIDDEISDTGLRSGRSSLRSDNNDNKALVGRLVLSPALGQEVGLSGYWGRYDNSNDHALSGIGVDTLFTMGPLELISEYAYFDVEETPTAARDLANYLQGAYAQLNYHFWLPMLNETFLGRGFDNPTFTLVGRYDWAKIHDDIDVGSGDNEEDRYTIGLNYRPVDSFVIKFEYQFNNTENETLEGGDDDGFISSIALGF